MLGVRYPHTVPGMSTLGQVVAAAVRAERARLDMDQGQLATALGWSRTTVSNLESGTRAIGVDDIVPICRALGVTLPQLVDRADPDDRAIIGI